MHTSTRMIHNQSCCVCVIAVMYIICSHPLRVDSTRNAEVYIRVPNLFLTGVTNNQIRKIMKTTASYNQINFVKITSIIKVETRNILHNILYVQMRKQLRNYTSIE